MTQTTAHAATLPRHPRPPIGSQHDRNLRFFTYLPGRANPPRGRAQGHGQIVSSEPFVAETRGSLAFQDPDPSLQSDGGAVPVSAMDNVAKAMASPGATTTRKSSRATVMLESRLRRCSPRNPMVRPSWPRNPMVRPSSPRTIEVVAKGSWAPAKRVAAVHGQRSCPPRLLRRARGLCRCGCVRRAVRSLARIVCVFELRAGTWRRRRIGDGWHCRCPGAWGLPTCSGWLALIRGSVSQCRAGPGAGPAGQGCVGLLC